jgi:SAM-dependent methyltransferase
MSRKTRILKHIRKDGIGLEIGPSHSPIAPKSDGFNVHIVDHTDKDSLIEKYRPHGVAVDNIEDVDFIWHGETYAELTGRKDYYDWIIASHVIEHTPDLVSFINNCAEILKKNGLLSLAVPDARFCFDCLRPITGISKIIDAHLQKRTIHSVGTAVEYVSEICTRGGRATWGYGKTRGNFELLHSQDEVNKVMQTYSSTEEYSDFHAWCFTPHSFRLLIHDLNLLGFISFKEISFAPTRGCEFYITLGQEGMGPRLSRIELMKKIRAELRVDTKFTELLKYKTNHWVTHIQQKLVDFARR